MRLSLAFLFRASNNHFMLQAVENEETFSYFYGVLSTDDLKILTFEYTLRIDFLIDHFKEILLNFTFFFSSNYLTLLDGII